MYIVKERNTESLDMVNDRHTRVYLVRRYDKEIVI